MSGPQQPEPAALEPGVDAKYNRASEERQHCQGDGSLGQGLHCRGSTHSGPVGQPPRRVQGRNRQRHGSALSREQRTSASAPGVGWTAACGGDGHDRGSLGGARRDKSASRAGSAPADVSADTTAPAEMSCAELCSRADTAASAAVEAEAAAGATAVASSSAAVSGAAAEATSVWDLEPLDFEEEEEEEGERKGGDHEPEQEDTVELDRPKEGGGRKNWQRSGKDSPVDRRAESNGGTDDGARNRTDHNVADGQTELRPQQQADAEDSAAVTETGRLAGVSAPSTTSATTPLLAPQQKCLPVAACAYRPARPGDSVDAQRPKKRAGTLDGGAMAAAAVVMAAPVATAVVATAVPFDHARELMPPPPPNIIRAKMRRRRSRVSLMHSPRYQRLCGLLERHNRRDDLLYAMLAACGLSERVRIVAPARATDVHLRAYHDKDYVEALRNPPTDVKTLDDYGLLEDCEVFEELYDHCCAVAGASLHAADRLCRGDADVGINWGGGRHHAKKGEAGGFCYVNDCVLAVLHLAKTFEKVLTIDIDVHHGDGIQEAFYTSNKVMTMSFHHLSKGFFPGSGQCSETGAGNGRDFNLNIPLKEGCGDASFLRVFTSAIKAVTEGFQPEAVVLICGADTLSADPLGPFNLSSAGIRSCLELVMTLDLPLLLLGGGGYCPTDTARLWTSLTAAAVGADALAALPVTVPDHCYFPLYGPDFRMATREKTLPDKNDDVFINSLCDFAAQAGRRVKAATRKHRERSSGSTRFGFDDSNDSW